MAISHSFDKQLKSILVDISKNEKQAVDALSLTLNKSATRAIKLAVEDISKQVALKPSYIKSKITVLARSAPHNLRTIVGANNREVLLSQYPHRKTKRGVAVRVDNATGFREMPKAFIVKSLRGSGATGIGMRNRDALTYFVQNFSKGKKTPAKAAKITRLRSKASSRPNGIYVAHSRSVNQMFTSSRETILPDLIDFALKTFSIDYKNKKAK